MEFCMDEKDQQQQLFSSPDLTASNSRLDDFFPAQNTEVDMSLEWLSVFVEDCLTSPGNCLPAAAMATPTTIPTNHASQASPITPIPPKPVSLKATTNCLENLKLFVVPGKARSKRKRVISPKVANPLTSWSYGHSQPFYFPTSDPPLLHQTHWLADSELIIPKKQNHHSNSLQKMEERCQKLNEQVIRVNCEKNGGNGNLGNKENLQLQAPRRCTHCQSQRTPQWRAGPLGPKTLCNACGVRYKSGRLLPEYRPAKSPTFVSYLHSNSHKKVLEMRNMATTSD